MTLAIQNYFSDIILLSAGVHRDEVFHPIDEDMKALFPEGKITPHMHITTIPIVRDKKSLWLKWRDEETSVTKKTIKENTYLWNTFLRDNWIATTPLKQEYLQYFWKSSV